MNSKTLVGALAVITLVVIICSGCTKTIVKDIYDCECVDTCDTVPPPPPPACQATAVWTGVYAGGTVGNLSSVSYVADSTFIKEGIAKLGNSPYSYYFTRIDLPIPECRRFSADSIRLDARVKNPLAQGAIEELDVSLMIVGETDSVWVNYIGRSYAQQHTYLGLYLGSQLNNVPELIQSFQDWKDVSLEVKNGVLSTYTNGTLIKSFTLPAGKKLGKVKKLQVGFKGTGSVDWVKALNSAGAMKVKEEFNTNLHSSVEWF